MSISSQKGDFDRTFNIIRGDLGIFATNQITGINFVPF